MTSRYLGARLAALAICAVVLAGVGSALEAAPAAALTNPGCNPQSPSPGECVPAPPESPPPVVSSGGCACEPAFSIEKRQQIAGTTSGFTKEPLTGAIGETVEYQITVQNTGSFPEEFSAFTDANCDPGTIAGGPGTSSLAEGEQATWTCRHVLTSSGTYSNEATVTGTSTLLGGTSLTLTSNRVVVEVPSSGPPPPPVPKLTIEKRQQVAGGSGGLTTSTVDASPGQTLDYQIVVKNTGEAPLTLTLRDERCDPGTLTGGPGAAPLEAGDSTTYSCTRLLSSPGSYANVATVTGTSGGISLTVTSNRVEALVPEPHPPAPAVVPATPTPAAPVSPKQEVRAFCEVRLPLLRGASGDKRTAFSAWVSSSGIARISFYLDGRKIKSMSQSQAKHGKFTITIDTRKLSYGHHKLSITTRMNANICPVAARSSSFVDPKPPPPPPG